MDKLHSVYETHSSRAKAAISKKLYMYNVTHSEQL